MSGRMSDEEFEKGARSGDPTRRSEFVREARRARDAEHDLQGKVLEMRSACAAAADRMGELREDIKELRSERDAARAEEDRLRREVERLEAEVDALNGRIGGLT